MKGQQQRQTWRVTLLPLARIVLAVLLVGSAVAVTQVLVKLSKSVLSLGGAAPAFYYVAYLISSVLVAYFVYRTYVRLVEKRAVSELSPSGVPGELGVGMLIGLGLVSAVVGLLWVLGDYRIAGTGAWAAMFVVLANDGAGAFVEEVLLRGVVFRITEERLGTWISLAISAVLFALLHLASSNATVVSAVMVGLEGGVLLCAAYVLTRRLWLAIGLHFAWDFAQDAIFGVSRGAEGFMRADLTGPALITGGDFAIEGSILALVLSLVVSAYLLTRADAKGHIVAPFWRRKPVDPNPPPAE